MSARALVRQSGVCLVLAALLLQLVLSFAHIHRQELAREGFTRSDVVSVSAVPARRGLHVVLHAVPHVLERLPSRLADDDAHCPICFSDFLLSTSSLPDAPVHLRALQFAAIGPAIPRPSDRLVRPRHTAFLSRAPPAA